MTVAGPIIAFGGLLVVCLAVYFRYMQIKIGAVDAEIAALKARLDEHGIYK